MISWSRRVGLLLVTALASVSIDAVPAHSQGTSAATSTSSEASAASATGSGSAAAGEPAGDPDEDGAGAGSGSALVAPAEPAARDRWLRERFSAALVARPVLAPARIGYVVVDLSTGRELVSRERERRLNLASNAKLLTAIAALSGLGGGFRWRTAVFSAEPDETGTVAGDLFVRGRGDPTLSVASLRQLAADVAARGVRNVEGRLVIDGSYFDDRAEPPHFDEQPKERAAFRAPVASFAVAHSAVTVTVIAEPGGAARVALEPETDSIKLGKVEVASVTTGRTRLRVDPRPSRDPRARDVVEIDVTGQIRFGEGSWELRRRVDDPQRFAAEVFRRALADQGVKIRGKQIATGRVPETAKQLAFRDSPPLVDVVRAMNKHSDNNIAEHLFKTLGAERKATPGPASWADASGALTAQLAKLGLAPGTYRSANGSGLYGASEVSPKQLLTLLAAAHDDYRIGTDLLGSLPAGGQDGTLARRYLGTPAMGRVRAKTGTLDKVITLAGYVGVDSDRVLGFAILVNDIPVGQRSVARAMIDDMIASLAAYLGAS